MVVTAYWISVLVQRILSLCRVTPLGIYQIQSKKVFFILTFSPLFLKLLILIVIFYLSSSTVWQSHLWEVSFEFHYLTTHNLGKKFRYLSLLWTEQHVRRLIEKCYFSCKKSNLRLCLIFYVSILFCLFFPLHFQLLKVFM